MRRPPEPDFDLPATQAAAVARAVAGDDAAAGDDARRDAFACLLYGLATGFALREAAPGAESGEAGADDAVQDAVQDEAKRRVGRVADLAVRLLRDTLRLGFREATRTVEAVTDALSARSPDPAVLGLVHTGAAAAGDWARGDRRRFEARVLQATADDAFASDRPLRPR